jgi:hypothetical protein
LPPGAAFSDQSWFGWLPVLPVTAATAAPPVLLQMPR